MSDSLEGYVLVIVHLSSIDTYLWERSYPAARVLADAIIANIHAGWQAIVVMDQKWPLREATALRREVLAHLQDTISPVYVIRHDELETPDPWGSGFEPVIRRLKRLRAHTVVLAGFWASENPQHGCVNETARQIMRRMPGTSVTSSHASCGWER